MAGSTDQFKLFWNALGINQKVTIVMSLVGVLTLMTVMLWWSGRPRMERAFKNLDDRDMNRVMEMLQGQKIPYQREGSNINVPAEFLDKATVLAASEGAISNGTGYEIFDKGGFGDSDFIQKTKGVRAKQGELERMIKTIEGIRNARVLVYEKENKLILDKYNDQPKATVMVDTSKSLTNQQIIGIRNIVAYGIGGLVPGNVSIVDNRGIALSDRVSEDGELAAASNQIKFQRQVEQEYRTKLLELLAPVYGIQNLAVSVGVKIDTQTLTETRDVFDPETKVARMEQTEKEKSESNQVQQDPIVGETPNTPVGLGGSVGKDPSKSKTTTSRDQKTVNYEISRVTTNVNRTPGTVQAITATVILNKVLPKAAAPATPAAPAAPAKPAVEAVGRTAEDLQRIEKQVSTALGPLASTITIAEAVFNPEENTISGPNIEDEMQKWLRLLEKPFVVVFAIVMVLLFLRMVKTHKPAITPIEVLTAGDDESLIKANVGSRPTPELLNELIQERPENVARALKSWSNIK